MHSCPQIALSQGFDLQLPPNFVYVSKDRGEMATARLSSIVSNPSAHPYWTGYPPRAATNRGVLTIR